MLRRLARGLTGKLGYEVRRRPVGPTTANDPVEASFEDERIWASVQPFTMASRLRTLALISSVRYVVENGVLGDLVECGVWRGGQSMAMALTLKSMDIKDRGIWLYDTFEGMSQPSLQDIEASSGIPASRRLSERNRKVADAYRCYASLEDVKANLATTEYPIDRLKLVRGQVEDSLREDAPEKLALLRLDTDWYSSTRHELEILYPRLSIGGVCLIDDYGHWEGARRAVDEYFVKNPPRPLLCRVDYTARILVKVS